MEAEWERRKKEASFRLLYCSMNYFKNRNLSKHFCETLHVMTSIIFIDIFLFFSVRIIKGPNDIHPHKERVQAWIDGSSYDHGEELLIYDGKRWTSRRDRGHWVKPVCRHRKHYTWACWNSKVRYKLRRSSLHRIRQIEVCGQVCVR